MWFFKRKKPKSAPDKMKYYIYISDAKLDMLYSQIPKPSLKQIASKLNVRIGLLRAELSTIIPTSRYEETRYSKLRVVIEYIEKHLQVGTVDAPESYFKGILPMQWGPIRDYWIGNAEPELVYFGGATSRTIFGLGGSAKHIVGNPEHKTLPNLKAIPSGPVSTSAATIVEILNSFLSPEPPKARHLSRFVRWFSKEKVPSETTRKQTALSTVIEANKRLGVVIPSVLEGHFESDVLGSDVPEGMHQDIQVANPGQRLEFLAKTLIIGTPQEAFYVNPQSVDRILLGTPIYVAIV